MQIGAARSLSQIFLSSLSYGTIHSYTSNVNAWGLYKLGVLTSQPGGGRGVGAEGDGERLLRQTALHAAIG